MKTKFYLAAGVCAACLALCVPLNAQLTPATTASPSATPKPAAARPTPFRGTVTAVDQTLKTFTIGKQTFKVTDSTVITKSDNPATMADIVQNEKARGSAFKQADGTMEAKTVKIGPKPGGGKKGKGKKAAAAAVSPTP
jgi:Domain of unknown function (DUF5666)